MIFKIETSTFLLLQTLLVLESKPSSCFSLNWLITKLIHLTRTRRLLVLSPNIDKSTNNSQQQHNQCYQQKDCSNICWRRIRWRRWWWSRGECLWNKELIQKKKNQISLKEPGRDLLQSMWGEGKEMMESKGFHPQIFSQLSNLEKLKELMKNTISI